MLGIKGTIKNIKSILKLRNGSKKILDKDVAEALKITPNQLCVAKRRESMLCKEILTWCHETGVDADFIFFGTDTEVAQ